jgi:hypothetical protein
MALAPSASAEPGRHRHGEPRGERCQSRGDFRATSQPITDPSPFQYPYGWLQGI